MRKAIFNHMHGPIPGDGFEGQVVSVGDTAHGWEGMVFIYLDNGQRGVAWMKELTFLDSEEEK